MYGPIPFYQSYEDVRKSPANSSGFRSSIRWAFSSSEQHTNCPTLQTSIRLRKLSWDLSTSTAHPYMYRVPYTHPWSLHKWIHRHLFSSNIVEWSSATHYVLPFSWGHASSSSLAVPSHLLPVCSSRNLLLTFLSTYVADLRYQEPIPPLRIARTLSVIVVGPCAALPTGLSKIAL